MEQAGSAGVKFMEDGYVNRERSSLGSVYVYDIPDELADMSKYEE